MDREYGVNPSEFESFLTESNLDQITKSRKKRERPFEDCVDSIESNLGPVVINGFLGSGGTKEVYDVEINGQRFALGLCGIQDSPSVLKNAWQFVLKEPDNTSCLRNLGLKVNPVVRIEEIKLNGFPFPAIVMRRYQDLDVTVFDAKNRSPIPNPLITTDTPSDLRGFLDLMTPIQADVAKLLIGGVRLATDSFNLCLAAGEPHLYFNDLGKMKIQPIPHGDLDWFAYRYTEHAIETILQSVNAATLDNPVLKAVDDEIGKDDSPLILEISNRILEMIKKN